MKHDEHAADARLVFDATATDYVAFVGTELSDTTEDVVDRSVLGAFIEFATSLEPLRPVADLGCGPGRVAALLSRSGIGTVGIDISPALVRFARDAHPRIPFAAGEISCLPVHDRCLGGAVCWYSIIYTPAEDLGGVFREMCRVISTRGPLLLAFQAGPAQPVRRQDAFGSGHPLTSYRHDPHVVEAALETSGFAVHATTVRSVARQHEDTPHAFVLAFNQGTDDRAAARAT